MTFSNARLREIINGYICVKEYSGGGHETACFKPYEGDWTEQNRLEYQVRRLEEKRLQEKQHKQEKEHQQKRALGAEERHRLYSEILNKLTIDEKTIDDLKRRGFTEEQIERCGFKSVHKWQPLGKKYDTRLPGISSRGDFLAIKENGYLCPLHDPQGRITAIQLRVYDPKDGNRYRWLSTPSRATLKLFPENENPLAVFHPSSGKPKAIAILEGTGAKPFLVSENFNYVAISAAGGQHIQSAMLMESYIKEVFEKYGELPIKIIPDAGWALNRQVENKLVNVTKWLQEKFGHLEIRVLDWNQVHKSQGDIDELSPLQMERLEQLKVNSFNKKYRQVLGSKQYRRWAEKRIKLTADITQHEQWFTIPDGIQNECQLLFGHRSLGGGKTQGVIEFLKPLNITTIMPGYRNSLSGNSIARANELGLPAQHIKDVFQMDQGVYINFAADDSIKLWAGCADSFHKFKAIIDRNPHYFVVIDEIVSVLDHLKGGGTLKGKQQQAIAWLTSVIENAAFVIFLDANLNDTHIKFIKNLFPHKISKTIDSVYPVKQKTFHFLRTESEHQEYSANSKYLPSHLVKIAKQHKRVLWISDSQRSCKLADEMFTSIGHKHFRYDGKTSNKDISKIFQADPVKFITVRNLDSVSFSPSAESGVSIPLFDYFNCVCFDIRGVLGIDKLMQLSGRLRDTEVPIYVACPEFVNMTNDPCPYGIERVKEIFSSRLDMILAMAGNSDDDNYDDYPKSEFILNMFKELTESVSNDSWFLDAFNDAKQLRYERQNLKLLLKTALQQSGHITVDLPEKVDRELHQEIKQTKEMILRQEAENLFNIKDITWEEAQEKSKRDNGIEVQRQIEKAGIKHKLPGIENSESWSPELIYQLQLKHPGLIDKLWKLKQLQDENLAKAVNKINNHYGYEHDFTKKDIWKSYSVKIKAMRMLGVNKLIEAETFSVKDEWVQELVEKYYADDEYYKLIGIPRAQKTSKDAKHVKLMVNRFLDYFGQKCEKVKTIKGNRVYRSITPKAIQELIQDIDNALNTKAYKLIAKAKEISLKDAVDKRQEQIRLEKEWEEKHKPELNKRILDVQSPAGCNDSITYIENQGITAPSNYIQYKLNNEALESKFSSGCNDSIT